MKICIVCARLSFGGAERVAVLWANGFLNAGHEVMVISNLFDSITYQLNDGIQIRNLVADNLNKIKKWGSSFFYVRETLKEFRPNVIIGVMPTCSFVSKVASIGLGIPVIATEHNSFERPPSAPLGFCDILSKYVLNKLYQHVTILTEADKLVIGQRLKNIHVMPNPLALVPVDVIPVKENVVLAAGRIDGWYVKGFDVLIRAWGNIMKNEEFRMKDSGWRLQIAGLGSEESLNYLKQLCRENGVENSVDFLGFVSDMEPLYKKASVFVLSSRYEGFGLVLIEAMSQGCACIACDYNGRQREIIEDDSQGLCCKPDDVESLDNALQRMIMDYDYRESVRQHAIERSKFYSITNTIDRWERYLTKIRIK